jgi:hypothetical protein
VPGPGPGAWIVAGLGAAAGSGGRSAASTSLAARAFIVSPLRAGKPRARVPGPANPRPAVTASAGQCDWGPWAAPSGDPGTPRPPWAANPGIFPHSTFAIKN